MPAVIAVSGTVSIGTVSIGTMGEYFESLAQRLTIDGLLERTLRHLTDEDLPRLAVTRSRFAGYTGLLGLTVPPRS